MKEATCEKCTEGKMVRREYYFLRPFLPKIGVLLLVIAVFGLISSIGMAGCMCLGGGHAVSQDSQQTDATAKGMTALLSGSMSLAAMIGGVVSVVPLLIVGFLLTLKRKVWACSVCGYCYDRLF